MDIEPGALHHQAWSPLVEHVAGVNTGTRAVLPASFSHAVGRAPRTCSPVQVQQQHARGVAAARANPAATTGMRREAHGQAQQHTARGRPDTRTWPLVGAQPILVFPDVIFRISAASLTRRNGKLKKEFDWQRG